jgi:parallel beta-helix repeat protein
MDRAGNIDLNTSEISFTTPAAGDALYVDVNAGSDNAACGSSGSPCKTITYALSKSAGNQTIRVAKGTYNAASGETFPLQLKAGTSLIGEGYWWKGVKVIKETFIEGTTPTILGANNANVVSCYVKPTAWGTSAAAIDDDGHEMTVFHCTVDGILDGRLQGVYFDGGSSLIDSRVENFAGPGGRSIAVWGAGGAVIRGNTVVNCSHGIALNASDSEVSGCVVENIEADGISAGKVDSVTTGVSIFRNHVADVGIDGVAIVNCDQVKITYNSVSGAAGYGISIWNRDEPTHLVDVFSNSVAGGNSSAVYILDGQARVNDNAFVCNVAGAFVRSDQVIDLRWNEWDHSPPTVNSGRSAVDPGCDGFYDICYEALYAGTPEPLYAPDGGKGSCVIGVVPSPRR